MPIRMWNGSGWSDGTVRVWNAAGAGSWVDGTVKVYPWVGAENLIDNLRYPIFAGNRFGKDEFPGNTVYAANSLFAIEDLQANLSRIAGACDVSKLSGESGNNSLVLSYAAPGVTTASAWAATTVASPVGGTAQPASFWDNSNYPNQSVGQLWAGRQVLVARARSSAAATILAAWITSKGAEQNVILVTDVYADAVTHAAAGVKVLFEVNSGYPGDGTVAAPDTLFGQDVYGVLMPASATNATLVNNVRFEGLRFWTYTADTPAVASAFAAMGVEGIYTNLPTTVASVPLPPNPDPEPPEGTGGGGGGGTPPPVNRGTWFGYGATSPGASSISGMISKGLRAPRCVRAFTGSTTPNSLSDSVLSSGYPLWLSWKPNPDSMMPNPNTWVPAAMTNLKGRIAKSTPTFITVWHEPEGSSDRGSNSLSAWITIWQNAQAALFDACVTARAEGWLFYVAPIICDWTFTDTSKGSASTWYSSSFVKYDVMGFDVYPVGQMASGSNRIARLAMNSDYNVKPYADAARRDSFDYIKRCAALAAQRGKPWGSAECGIIAGKEYGGDSLYRYYLSQRAQRFTDITNHLLSLSNPPLLWTWWHEDSCNVINQTPDDTWGKNAFNASIATSPTTPPRP